MACAGMQPNAMACAPRHSRPKAAALLVVALKFCRKTANIPASFTADASATARIVCLEAVSAADVVVVVVDVVAAAAGQVAQ